MIEYKIDKKMILEEAMETNQKIGLGVAGVGIGAGAVGASKMLKNDTFMDGVKKSVNDKTSEIMKEVKFTKDVDTEFLKNHGKALEDIVNN